MWYSGFSGGSEVKASACSVGDLGLIPGLRKSTGEGNGNPLQYSCLQNPWTEEPSGLQSTGLQSQTWLSDFIFAFTFSATFKYTLLLDSVTICIIPSLFFTLSIHFHVLVIVNNAAMNMVRIYMSSLPWDVHPELGLLDHVVLFLYFWGTSVQIFLWQLHQFTCSPYVDSFKWSLPESRNVGSKNELAYCTLFQR